MTSPVVAEDYFGDSITLRYHIKNEQIEQQPVEGLERPRQSLQQFLKTAFLPEGYPDSVSEDYWNYQKWDSLQVLKDLDFRN